MTYSQNDRTIEFRTSTIKIFGLAAIMLALTAASIFMVFTGSGPERGLGMAGTALFGFTAIVAFRRAIHHGGRPTLTLSPEGFRDIRIDDNVVPWAAVREITKRKIGRYDSTIVVAPFEADVAGFDRDKWISPTTKLLGNGSLGIDASDLEGGFDHVYEMFKSYHQEYGRPFGRR